MARKTVVISDLSGEQIQDGKGAKVRITFDDAHSGSVEMDVTADEARAGANQHHRWNRESRYLGVDQLVALRGVRFDAGFGRCPSVGPRRPSVPSLALQLLPSKGRR